MIRGEYSLVNMAGEPQRVVELFPTGKSQEPRVTLLQVFTSAQSDRDMAENRIVYVF